MRTVRGLIGIVFVTGIAVLSLRSTVQGTSGARREETFNPSGVSVYFSPKGGCTEAVVRELDGAKASIRVQAYSFTSAPIAKALVDAHRRGVDVAVILDKSQRSERYACRIVSRLGQSIGTPSNVGPLIPTIRPAPLRLHVLIG